MKIHHLTITNFRSFKAKQTFIFPKEPGLYFIQGINSVETRLEANGAGKTSLWEALTWLFFAKTSRGLKAGDVCNWEATKGTVVELVFEVVGAVNMSVMRRSWSPNSWTLTDLFGNVTDLAKDKGNPVLALLHLEFAPFLNSVLMSQGQPMFLDLKHDGKAALFSEVMGLDRWLDYSSRASKAASAQDAVSRDLERSLSGLRGKLLGLQGQDLGKSREDWEDAQRKKVKRVTDRYEDAVESLIPVKAQLPVLTEQVKLAREQVATRSAAANIEEDLERARRAFDSCFLNCRALQQDYDHALKLQKQPLDGNCPTCGQQVTEHTKMPVKNLRTLRKELEVGQAEADQAKTVLDALEKEVAQLVKALNHSRDRLELAIQELKELQRNIQLKERELDQMEDLAEALLNEVNPYARIEDEARRQIGELQHEIESKVRLLDDSNGAYSINSFWVRGFKELRLQLIAEALNELELEVNSCVTSLGLVDWELVFQVDRETKGGSIQRGFNVLVRSPHNSAGVPWEAWSGGESQRLRLAATMGLANLIRSRSGTHLNIECWDEPSTGLSQQGVRDLLEALAVRARTEQRLIFMVDHTAHSFGGFSGSVCISKTEQGSLISPSWAITS